MPGDYLALIGPEPAIGRFVDEHRLEGLCRAHGITLRAEQPGFRLFAADRVPLTTTRASTVLGIRFRRDWPGAAGGQLAARAAQPRADEDWGPYLAFARRSPGEAFEIVRDPSGQVEAWWAVKEDVTCICGDGSLPLLDQIWAPSLDTSALVQRLAFADLRAERTPRAGLRELLPGTVWRAGRLTPSVQPWWSPASFASGQEPVGPPQDLRNQIVSVTAALARHAGNILIELSGGLDSSIVAAALAASKIEARACTIVTAGPDGDEERFARTVAERFGFPLDVLRAEASACFSEARPGARPGPDPVLRALDELLAGHAERTGADALFSGAGGDNVFCSLRTAAPVLDAWLAGRSLREIVRAALELGAARGEGIWRVLRLAARKWRRRDLLAPWLADARFLARGAVPSQPDPHPWLTGLERCPPGSREHVRLLVLIQKFRACTARALVANPVTPLLSRPVMEACLKMPSWRWFEGGRDRAIARRAFRDDLPAEIVNRRTKGGLQTHYMACFAEGRSELRCLLGDGELRRRALLDWPAVEAVLEEGAVLLPGDVYRLFDLVGVELWARGVLARRH